MNKFYFIFLLFFVSCSSQKSFVGVYKSNFPELGFFGTKINFKKDSTFEYTWSGDLEYKYLIGKYFLQDNHVYLKFDKKKGEIDSVKFKNDFSEFSNFHNYELKNENGIIYHLKYKIKGGKLFSYHIKTEKLVTKAQFYGKRKFIFFGPKRYLKRSYLLKK